MTETLIRHCGRRHPNRECCCYQPNCCEGSKPHCGKTSYGCWFADFTAEELAEMKAMALDTIQSDADLNWFAQPGGGKSSGVIVRDTGGNDPIFYDANDVHNVVEGEETLPEEPRFGKDWLKATKEEQAAYAAKCEEFREEYFKHHPDLVFAGHHHPGRVMRLIRMAERNLPPTVPKGTVIHDDGCVGLPGCLCKRVKK